MVNPITTNLIVTICDDAKDACEKGFDWTRTEPPVKPIELKQAVIVRNGTQAGNSTVDFLVEDESGQRYVFMVTANILKSLPL